MTFATHFHFYRLKGCEFRLPRVNLRSRSLLLKNFGWQVCLINHVSWNLKPERLCINCYKSDIRECTTQVMLSWETICILHYLISPLKYIQKSLKFHGTRFRNKFKNKFRYQVPHFICHAQMGDEVNQWGMVHLWIHLTLVIRTKKLRPFEIKAVEGMRWHLTWP